MDELLLANEAAAEREPALKFSTCAALPSPPAEDLGFASIADVAEESLLTCSDGDTDAARELRCKSAPMDAVALAFFSVVADERLLGLEASAASEEVLARFSVVADELLTFEASSVDTGAPACLEVAADKLLATCEEAVADKGSVDRFSAASDELLLE
mmetsp:Transcript_52488/g.137706  ORF Transcript_52488/g.137706 Transcript_52488/m.137706 type:complete len:158 (-) Transcript_52488:761-1234(-)